MIDKNYNPVLIEELKKDYPGMSEETVKSIYPFEISQNEHMIIWARQTQKALDQIKEDSPSAYKDLMIEKPFGWLKKWEGKTGLFEIAFSHLKQVTTNGNNHKTKTGEPDPYTYRDAWLLSWDKDLYDKIIYKKQKPKYDKKPFKERMIYS